MPTMASKLTHLLDGKVEKQQGHPRRGGVGADAGLLCVLCVLTGILAGGRWESV